MDSTANLRSSRVYPEVRLLTPLTHMCNSSSWRDCVASNSAGVVAPRRQTIHAKLVLKLDPARHGPARVAGQPRCKVIGSHRRGTGELLLVVEDDGLRLDSLRSIFGAATCAARRRRLHRGLARNQTRRSALAPLTVAVQIAWAAPNMDAKDLRKSAIYWINT